MLPRMRDAAGTGDWHEEMEGRAMIFYVGMFDVYHAKHLPRNFINVNRLRKRKGDFEVGDWIMDSGAFTEISEHGKWRSTAADYATQIERWRRCGNLQAAVAQDMMCEPFILEKTGLTTQTHQAITIERYLALRDMTDVPIMPVIQGYNQRDYIAHLAQYGTILEPGAWVGVGSVCKRNTDPRIIEYILCGIKAHRPDLRLHGFGLKISALKHHPIRQLLYSADSMAWSYHAHKNGRDNHDWREADRFRQKIERDQVDLSEYELVA